MELIYSYSNSPVFHFTIRGTIRTHVDVIVVVAKDPCKVLGHFVFTVVAAVLVVGIVVELNHNYYL